MRRLPCRRGPRGEIYAGFDLPDGEGTLSRGPKEDLARARKWAEGMDEAYAESARRLRAAKLPGGSPEV